jgi:hypothetical protein
MTSSLGQIVKKLHANMLKNILIKWAKMLNVFPTFDQYPHAKLVLSWDKPLGMRSNMNIIYIYYYFKKCVSTSYTCKFMVQWLGVITC